MPASPARMLGIFQSYMPPDAFTVDTSGQLVFQTVIGGAGTLLGPAVGAAVWLFLRDELQQIPGIGSLWMFILGAIFVLLVTLLRKGLYGTVVVWWQSRVATPAPQPEPRPTAMRSSPRASAAPPSAAGAAATPALEARSVSKHFGGVRAVSGVSLAVPAGRNLRRDRS